MIVLSLTEEDRVLLLALRPAQRNQVFLALLTGAEGAPGWDVAAQDTLSAIRRREAGRRRTRERVERYRSRYSARYSNGHCNGESNLPPSPSPPLPPPSPLSPEPPISSPPYYPPSPSPTPSVSASRGKKAARNAAKDADFDVFWAEYPKKVGKQPAKKAFGKVKVPVETLVAAVRRQKCSSQWTKNNGDYIPNPSKWLNEQRWEDELPQGNSANPFLTMLEEEP